MIDISLIVGRLISLFFFFRLLVPVSMIICNDIMAYMFGFFFGKTPLIQLSPKKTWEGFIGGAISTVFFGFLVLFIITHTLIHCYITFKITETSCGKSDRAFAYSFDSSSFYAPLVKEGILFCNCRSVGRSVDQVLSAQYLLTPSLDQYQTWCKGCP